ncbi:MAG: hypothetical protein M1818_005502 [Claussenomyces sp. TS43310]|nr:MAG: hypothetical protein M1818_005502 [Claussenomyces sp. TS43310]
MGGKAFPLPTPRMPPDVYQLVKRRCHAILKQHFRLVGTPIEGPEKEDFGDVDFLVTGPRAQLVGSILFHTLGQAMGAVSCVGSVPKSFAVPWPVVTGTPVPGDGDVVPGSQAQHLQAGEARFVQVDVSICADDAAWEWEMFLLAHGDLWSMLGSSIKPAGLTINDKGLWLRIEEMEALDRRKSLIFLTRVPQRVLEFLGLDEGAYGLFGADGPSVDGEDARDSTFTSAWQMFEYVASCRLFWTAPSPSPSSKIDSEQAVEQTDPSKATPRHDDLPLHQSLGRDDRMENSPRALKNDHDHRRRMAQRPVFRRYVDEFLPHCRASGRYPTSQPSREKIKEEAYTTFGDALRVEYDDRLRPWRRNQQNNAIWRAVIETHVPVEGVDPRVRARAIKRLKRFIEDRGRRDGERFVATEAAFTDREGVYVTDVVARFVAGNWDKMGQGAAR